MSKVVTGVVRLSYVNVFEPKAINGQGDAKYSVCVMVDKNDQETLKAIKQAIRQAYEEGKSKLAGKNGNPATLESLKLPLRDGDVERADQEEFNNCMFFNANSSKQPQVVDKKVQPILDQDEVYSGMYARVSVNFYAYNFKGTKGIGCGLNHIQKIRDGENLGGSSSASADFGEFVDNSASTGGSILD